METYIKLNLRIRWSTVIILGILVSIINLITISRSTAFPAGPIPEEQTNRLVEAAWKEPVRSLDAVVYKQILRPPESEEEIREFYEKTVRQTMGFSETEPIPKWQLLTYQQAVQRNTERQMEEAKAGRRVKQRIRINGTCQRIDQTIILPEMVLLKGTPHEERRPATEHGPDDPYEMTFLYRDSSEYRYNHMSKSVTIFARSKLPMIRDIQEFTSQTKILQEYLGTFKSSENPLYLPDPEKIQRLAETGLLDNDRWLTISPDPNAPGQNVRIEIGRGEKPGAILTCDKEDYSKVYAVKVYNPHNGQLLLERQFREFDENGFPHFAIWTEYNLDGRLKEKEIYQVESITLNPDIPPEVFAPEVPQGYQVHDLRDPEKFRQETEQEMAEIRRAEQILRTQNMEQIKPLLSHPEPIIRIKALMTAKSLLRKNPKELKEIAESMQNDPRQEIRELAANILEQFNDQVKHP